MKIFSSTKRSVMQLVVLASLTLHGCSSGIDEAATVTDAVDFNYPVEIFEPIAAAPPVAVLVGDSENRTPEKSSSVATSQPEESTDAPEITIAIVDSVVSSVEPEVGAAMGIEVDPEKSESKVIVLVPESEIVDIEPVVIESKIKPVVVESKIEPVVVESKIEPDVVESKLEPEVVESKLEPAVVESNLEPAVIASKSIVTISSKIISTENVTPEIEEQQLYAAMVGPAAMGAPSIGPRDIEVAIKLPEEPIIVEPPTVTPPDQEVVEPESEILIPDPKLTISSEILYPSNGDILFQGRSATVMWKISTDLLVVALGFDISIYNGAQDSIAYRNSTITTSVCSDSGDCSMQISGAAFADLGADHDLIINTFLEESTLEVQSKFNVVVDPDVVEEKAQELPPPTSSEINRELAKFSYDDAFFVSTTGSSSASGTTADEAFKSIQQAVNLAGPGDIVFVEAGDYGNQNLEITQSGEPGAPIRIYGYQRLPGDSPAYDSFDHNTTVDASLMPMLDGQDRSGGKIAIRVDASYIDIRNFQIQNHTLGFYSANMQDSHVENINARSLGTVGGIGREDYDGVGIKFSGSESNNNILKGSSVVNSTGEGISIAGNDNVIEYNTVYSDDNSTGSQSATDYYFLLYNASRNIVRNNYIERVGNLGHVGHGFTALYKSQYNLFENNRSVNLMGGGFVVRYYEAAHNTFRNNTVEGGSGILVSTGGHNNLFENMTINNVNFGIWAFNSKIDPLNTGGHGSLNNTFLNISINNASSGAIILSDYTDTNAITEGNVFDGLKINNAPYLFRVGHDGANNILRNSTVKNVSNYDYYFSGKTPADLGFSIDNVIFQDNGF